MASKRLYISKNNYKGGFERIEGFVTSWYSLIGVSCKHSYFTKFPALAKQIIQSAGYFTTRVLASHNKTPGHRATYMRVSCSGRVGIT